MTGPNTGEVPAPAQPQVVVQVQDRAPGLLIRVVWFLFVGWWLGQLAILSAWVFNVLIVTLPPGMYILNRLPQVFTLRPARQEWLTETTGQGVTVVKAADIPQREFWIRAVFFVLVGWWFSLIWLEAAWLAGVTLILLPLSFWMFGKSAAVTTLRVM